MRLIYWYILIVLISLMIYLYIQNNFITINTYRISVPRLQSKMQGKKMVFFSDTHFKDRNSHYLYDQLLEKINLLKPEIILFGGDIVHASASEIAVEHAKDFFFQVSKIAPTYVIFGNHDIRNERANDIYTQLKIAGVNFLNNEATWISFGELGIGFWLMGLKEYETALDKKVDILDKIKLPKDSKNEPKILLAHYPQYFEKYLLNDYTRPDLVLSGHTHGGQMILPYIGGLFAPGQGSNPFYDYGLFKSENYPSSRLILTRGIGNSSFPFRINNRPELVVIEFN